VALTPDGTRLYAVVDDGVVAVATATRTVTRLPLKLFRPMRAAVSPDGRSLLVTGDTGPGTIWTIDVATSKIIQVTTPAGGYPTGIAFSPDGALSYLTEALPPALAVRPVRSNTYVP
jgi:DNA-binding beta-propeller fold protein YncE